MSRLVLRSAREFLTEAGGRQPDAVAPLASAGITFVGGGVGMGKTLIGMEIAVTKATGESEIGLVAQPGRVLLVAADMAPEDYRGYLRMVVGRRDRALDDLVITTPRDLYLDDDEDANELRQSIQASGAELVVMDYFDLFLSGDGYSPKELRPIVSTLAEIRDEDKVALVMLDQTRKQGNSGRKSTAPEADELFGGRMKSALADRIWFTKRDTGSGFFTLTPAKQRGVPLAPIVLAFDAETGWQREEARNVHLTPGDDQILSFVNAARPGQGRTCKEIERETNLSESAVRHGLRRLQSYGLVTTGPKAGREFTYKSATLHNTADQSAFAVPMNSASLHSPIKGVQQSSGDEIDDVVSASDIDARFGEGASQSQALSAYALVRPTSDG